MVSLLHMYLYIYVCIFLLSLFRCVNPGICLTYVNGLYSKTISVKQMSFYSFSQTGGHSITFSINSAIGCAVLYILQSGVFELIDQWHFAIAVCDANFNWMRRSNGYYFLRIHTCPLRHCGDILGTAWLQATGAMWLFERWHFSRTIFHCEYGWVATGHRSIPPCVNTVCCETSSWLSCPPPPPPSAVTERHTLHTHTHPCILLSHIHLHHCFNQQLESGSSSSPADRKERVEINW